MAASMRRVGMGVMAAGGFRFLGADGSAARRRSVSSRPGRISRICLKLPPPFISRRSPGQPCWETINELRLMDLFRAA